MHNRQKWMAGSLMTLGGGVLWAALATAPAAPAAKPDTATPAAPAKPDPVAEQVKAGLAVYTKSCQGCHGDKLQGVRAPALVSEQMAKDFTGAAHPYADLHSYVSKAMPLSAPGSLTEQQYLDVVAFVLSRNDVALPEGGLTKAALKEPALSARAAQVGMGLAVYTKSCQGCHGDKLQGVRGPTLMGAAFVKKWATVGDLHTKVAKTMPKNAPASLSSEQYLAVVAFLLEQNKVVGGAAALGTADLKTKLK